LESKYFQGFNENRKLYKLSCVLCVTIQDQNEIVAKHESSPKITKEKETKMGKKDEREKRSSQERSSV
jgi:hypothetical protein